MSSLFQGLTEPDGRVKVTTSATGTVPLRGLMVSPEGRVLIAEDTGQARVHHSGRAFDPATGALLVDPAAVTEVLGMGGMTVDINGGVITKGVVPDVIHQGVGLTNEGYLAIDRGAPEGSIFFAPLSSNVNEVVAGLTANYNRSLEALYERTPGQWAIAADGVPRFESERLLMEPATTNKCENYNANPDAGFTGLTKAGDAAGIMSRVFDPAALAAAGLSNICTDAFVIRMDNSAGSGNAWINIDGLTGNTNTHTISAWVRKVSGAADVFFRLNDNSINTGAFANTSFQRVSATGTPGTTAVRCQLLCLAGTVADVVLNQLEEASIVSTPIITRGASASRGLDTLYWSGMNGFFPDAQGMVWCDWRPKYLRSQLLSPNRGIVTRGAGAESLLYHDAASLKAYDGVNPSSIGLPGSWNVGDLLRAVTIWGPAGPGALTTGYYHAPGGWTWDLSPGAYDGAWQLDDGLYALTNCTYPTWLNNITLYDANQGTAWVEANLTP